MAALLAYAWPGNVRELKNLVVRLHLVVRDRSVSLTHLPAEILWPRPTRPRPGFGPGRQH